MKNTARPIVVSLVSLGCAKNTVDSERILGRLVEAGFLLSEDPAQAGEWVGALAARWQ